MYFSSFSKCYLLKIPFITLLHKKVTETVH